MSRPSTPQTHHPPPPVIDLVSGDHKRSTPPTPPPPIVDVSGHYTVQPGFDRSFVGMTRPVTLTHANSKPETNSSGSTSPPVAYREIPIHPAANQKNEDGAKR